MNPKVKTEEKKVDANRELTDKELDVVVGGGKYDAHGNGINHGNGPDGNGNNGNGPKNT